MILSVVVVSYNVKFFLEQCLSSLKNAVEGSFLLQNQTQVFIVDNASSDGTCEFLEPRFPEFRFVRNSKNSGFAKANNQVLADCSGEFILFLNPDTILPEDCLEKCISFFRHKPDAGAVGVKMINGSGKYLKESKRGFPGALTSFYKMSGLSALFPHSKKIAAYYMGHLSENSSHAVDILSGAFMIVKKSILNLTGGFDEQFFMYGEDIDLSYRITQAGFQNYYFAETAIIHFKGESTLKDVRYIEIFYGAMNLFVKKHFKKSGSRMQFFFIKTGVWFHKMLAGLYLPLRKQIKPDHTSPIFIQGDKDQREKWKRTLLEMGINVTDNKNLAKQIIYCQGTNESWRSIIQEIQTVRPGIIYQFHGSGTHAAVGSNISQKRSNVLPMKSGI